MGKNIVLCCDGTGQKFQENKSNPLRLHYCLRNDDSQVSFYDPGVGTFDSDGQDYSAGFLGDLWSSVSKTVEGGGLGYGIVKNIEDGYRYLMNTYEDGDRIYLFGFSRGAFTAQAIAGVLNKCGLLGPNSNNLVPYALRIYLQKDNPRIAKDFKSTMARDCRPHMVGVWDTVKSLGNNHQNDFFYRYTAENCEYGYQALSIDEKRADFVPSTWEDPAGTENVEQVWFAGVHSDVGGGYPEDGLANAALRWMIAKAKACGVQFRDNRVTEFDPDPLGAMHESHEGKWIFLGEEKREIPEGAKVHDSADERRRNNDDYNPTNFPADFEVVRTAS